MATELTGSVELKRIHEFLNKLLNASGTENSDYKILIDKDGDDSSFNISISQLEAVILLTEKAQIVLNTLYRPVTEPVVSLGTPNTLAIDFADRVEAIIEPKKTSGSRTIDVDFTISFSSDSNLAEGILRPQLSGTRILTFPSNVKCSNPGAGTWDDVAKTWTIEAGTDEIYNMSLEKDRQGSFYDLVVGGVAI